MPGRINLPRTVSPIAVPLNATTSKTPFVVVAVALEPVVSIVTIWPTAAPVLAALHSVSKIVSSCTRMQGITSPAATVPPYMLM